MARNDIATDSAFTLHELTGDDATATFEDDPKFVESNPTGNASSENVEIQRDTDDTEDSDEEEEDAEEDDEDFEDEEDDEEEDDEEEDDGDEIAARSTMRADGLLGYEDEAEDSAKGRSRKQGDAERAHKETTIKDGSGDDDAGDVDPGIDEDSLDKDDMDTDTVAAPRVAAYAMPPMAEIRA